MYVWVCQGRARAPFITAIFRHRRLDEVVCHFSLLRHPHTYVLMVYVHRDKHTDIHTYILISMRIYIPVHTYNVMIVIIIMIMIRK